VPSGHAQNGVVGWGTIANRIKNRWAWIIAILVMFLIGISRIYLAVHFPHDVILGWIFGAVILWILLHFEMPVLKWFKKYSTGIQLLIVFLSSMLLILLVVIAQLFLHSWNIPLEWINNAQLAIPEEDAINHSHSTISFQAQVYSLAYPPDGLALKTGRISTHGSWWKLMLPLHYWCSRVLILYVGLGSIFAETETFISYGLRYIRYALIGFWISGFAPWLFIKLKIADHAE
jgi:hypothetical protein